MFQKKSAELTGEDPLRILMVTGIYPTPEKPHKGTFVKVLVDSLIQAGVEVEVVHPDLNLPAPLRYLSATAQIFVKTLTGRFDVVHGHYDLWCLACRFQWTTAVVASYLGDDVLGTFTADGGHSKKGAFVATISRKLSYWVEAVTVKSEQMKQRLHGPENRVFVIADGINLQQFQPVSRAEIRAQLGWDQQRNYVLFANNPAIPVKNFALAQAAVEHLHARGIDVELVVANGLSHDTVVQYMNASNALILPSKAEGSPNVVKEAMACNIPVVATNVGDVATVISRTAGCSICADNAEDFAAGIEKALAHQGPTTGREDIRHLDSAVIAQQTIEVYQRITKRAHSRTQRPIASEVRPEEKVYAQKN